MRSGNQLNFPVFWVLLAVWVGACVFLFYLTEWYSPPDLLPFLPLMVGWLLLCIAAGWSLARKGRRYWPRLAVLFIAAVAFWFGGLPISSWALENRLHAEFEEMRPTYDEVVSQVLVETAPAEGMRYTHRLYVVAAGPPVVIGFPTGRVSQHLQQYVVFDPTDSIVERAGTRPPPPVFDSLNLVSCESVVDHYYRCWFE